MKGMHQSHPSASASTYTSRLSLKVFSCCRPLFSSDSTIRDSICATFPLFPQNQHSNVLCGHRRSTSADGGSSKPLPRCHCLTQQMSHGKCNKLKLFVPRRPRANRSASFFPSPDNVPQPGLRGTTSGDEETVQSTTYLFFNVFDEVAKKGVN